MQFFDNDDWVISSAGGVTGEAYIAQSGNEKIFLKRNSSPFLAVLSAEGIVPKLLRTKRLENGDVVTFQKYLNGRELKASEMKSDKVARLLKKIHTSEPLVFMLSRLGKTPMTTESILKDCQKRYSKRQKNPAVEEALIFLKRSAGAAECPEKVVCHSDINHNNWILSEENQLYLVDWDQAVIADPALDLALLLYWYIDQDEWKDWLENYGQPLTDHLKLRMHWYMLSQTLLFMFWHQDHHQPKEALLYEKDLLKLNQYSWRHFSSYCS
ncbi:phosphotransferase [Scopulibacillus daqui]|nr:phosphotransferase family protein [Scopulibacillus daqui]